MLQVGQVTHSVDMITTYVYVEKELIIEALGGGGTTTEIMKVSKALGNCRKFEALFRWAQ